MWRRVSSYGDGYVPRSLLEQHIVAQSWSYEWCGGRPDPRQLPEGYAPLDGDMYRARRVPQAGDRLVRVLVWLLAAWVAVRVLLSV